MINNLQNQLQNIPVIGWLSMKMTQTSRSDGCSIYPNILNDIEYRNTYWQIFRYKGSTFHLYGAYFGKIFNATFCIQLQSAKVEQSISWGI